MDRTKKVILTIIIDFILLGFVVAAVIALVKGNVNAAIKNVLTWGIVICIPVGFGITCWNVIGGRFDNLNEPHFDEADEEGEDEYDNETEL